MPLKTLTLRIAHGLSLVKTFASPIAPGMTMLSLGDGLYALELNYLPSNLLFARLNPNNQSEVWNQTVDLTYVSPLNLFTLTSWDNGTWSTFTA